MAARQGSSSIDKGALRRPGSANHTICAITHNSSHAHLLSFWGYTSSFYRRQADSIAGWPLRKYSGLHGLAIETYIKACSQRSGVSFVLQEPSSIKHSMHLACVQHPLQSVIERSDCDPTTRPVATRNTSVDCSVLFTAVSEFNLQLRWRLLAAHSILLPFFTQLVSHAFAPR